MAENLETYSLTSLHSGANEADMSVLDEWVIDERWWLMMPKEFGPCLCDLVDAEYYSSVPTGVLTARVEIEAHLQ